MSFCDIHHVLLRDQPNEDDHADELHERLRDDDHWRKRQRRGQRESEGQDHKRVTGRSAEDESTGRGVLETEKAGDADASGGHDDEETDVDRDQGE